MAYVPSTQGEGAWSACGHSFPAGQGVHSASPLPEM